MLIATSFDIPQLTDTEHYRNENDDVHHIYQWISERKTELRYNIFHRCMRDIDLQ